MFFKSDAVKYLIVGIFIGMAISYIGLSQGLLTLNLSRDEVFKIIPIPFVVLMGLFAIVMNNHRADKRENEKRRKDKIEVLYIASIEYNEVANKLFSEYLRLKKKRGESNSGSADKADVEPLRLVIHKLEMLFSLYFKDVAFDVNSYDLKSLPVITQMLSGWTNIAPPDYSPMEDLGVTTRNNINDNSDRLIGICHELMAKK